MAALPKGFVPLEQLTEVKGQKRLNGWMGTRSFCEGGCVPTALDRVVFEAVAVTVGNNSSNPNLYRWYQHIASFTPAERAAWGGDAPTTAGESKSAPAPAKPAKKAASAPAADDDDDDDLDDMFGSDDDDDDDYFNSEEAQKLAKAHQAKLDAKRKKKGTRDRTTFLFDVKPYETETDLNAMAASIKGIEHEGIQNWGQEHQLLPVAFGIKKLRLQVIVFDDAIGQDDLEDLINELHEDDVQSIDMVSVQKV